jgi:flagellar biosynthetic protein FliO
MLAVVVCSNVTAMAAAATTSRELPTVGPSIVRLLGAFALVLAILFAAVWVFRHWQRFAPAGSSPRKLQILENRMIGQRQSLFVVRYENQQMLLAASASGISLVTHLPTAEESAERRPEQDSVPANGFLGLLGQALRRQN